MDKEKDDGKKCDGKKDEKDDLMLRSAVHYTVHKISEACAQQFKVQFSKESILAISDHMFRNMENTGRELELFAKHAKRTKINPDDVKLLFRNSPDMTPHLDAVLRKRDQEKRDARPLPTSKAKEAKQSATKTATADVGEEKLTSRPASPEMAEPEKMQQEEENEAMDFENDF